MNSKIEGLNERLAKAYLGGGQARIDKTAQKEQTHCQGANSLFIG